ncbi:arf-GAP with dual PH domain-containing protein 2-like isoform X2 [Sinocyclocheilus anshuiensis]|uniref:arf-GAP with dual PH domain-containing protein 2-like isoform X2 n=1 Tax=Sinocyclocheilus anshuiensis TaxID=1608454 RepID=UPI0007B9DBC0|nr:PREDICTED: arf-GAP with dual PH domain-containing protein 2-like isoform X2 [Sinocyclocheilus anshuiensis]
MANREKNKKTLLELAKLSQNCCCADCGAADPDWASCTLGIFVCLNCSGTHRNLPSVSRIKSIRLDFWDDELVQFMKANGNRAAKNFYEKFVPVFYYQPQPDDCEVLREQWIRAKYERMEFTEKNRERPYTAGVFEGMLWKKGKDNGQFLERKFVLSVHDFTLKYYKEDESKGPKATISVKDLNATFQPEKIGHAYGLQITYCVDHHTRNLFVYHKNGQEIVNWFNAIRAIRHVYLKTAFPTASDGDQREPFKKRWFILDSLNRKLLYFKTQLDAIELGVVFIGSENHGYSVRECVPKGTRGNKWKCGVIVETPDRQFVFMCEQERDQREWVEALKTVISKPMMPQDYTTEANIRRRR